MKEKKLYNKTSKSPVGTSLQQYVNVTYNKLENLFGEPNAESDGYKVSIEWNLEDNKGRVLTIYDYKETSLYDSTYPTPEEFLLSIKETPYSWHIGAGDQESAEALKNYIENN